MTGYTEAELSALYVDAYERFSQWEQRASYLANHNNRLMVEVDLPPLMEPLRHKAVYVEARIAELCDLREKVREYQRQLGAHLESMERDIRSHLWVTDDFFEPASKTLRHTEREVDALSVRVEKLIKGFQALPREGAPVVPAEAKTHSKQRGSRA